MLILPLLCTQDDKCLNKKSSIIYQLLIYLS